MVKLIIQHRYSLHTKIQGKVSRQITASDVGSKAFTSKLFKLIFLVKVGGKLERTLSSARAEWPEGRTIQIKYYTALILTPWRGATVDR